MNDDVRFERLFADGLHELAPRRAPDRLRTTVKAQSGEMRPRARWLALIKEPTMRTNNRLAVGSPTARVAAIMAATLLAVLMLAGAGIAGARLFAANGAIVVDADGGGHFTTIQAAVDAADDGDEILVQPGTYAEEIVIDKDITLRGEGPVDEVVVGLADDSFVTLIALNGSDARVENLTLRGGVNTQGMTIAGGAPIIAGVVFDDTGVPYESGEIGQGGSLEITGGTAQVLDNQFVSGGEISVHADADVVMEGNEFRDGPHLYLEDPGDAAIVRGNTFSGTYDRAMGLFGESTMTIEGNTIDGAGGDGITVGWTSAGTGRDPLIRDNDISSTNVGIMVFRDAHPVVTDNRLHGNETGIQDESDSVAYTGNELSANDVGIELRLAPSLDGNSIIDGGVGMQLLGGDALPALQNNTVCGNQQNVQLPVVGEVPQLEYDDTNEICEDPPAA